MTKVIGLIPARMESSRLPNKPLLPILGMPMVIHVAMRASMSKKLDEVIVCTDSIEIARVCFEHQTKCCLTGSYHNNGTERIAEAANILRLTEDDVIVDIQGDEPLIRPESIDLLVENFQQSDYEIMLPYLKFADVGNKNIVKISESNGKILYMSRSDIPYPFTTSTTLKKHLSIIAFTYKAIVYYSKLPKGVLEKVESIELLRGLEAGMSIGTFEVVNETFSVDIKDDYEKAIRAMRDDDLCKQYIAAYVN